MGEVCPRAASDRLFLFSSGAMKIDRMQSFAAHSGVLLIWSMKICATLAE